MMKLWRMKKELVTLLLISALMITMKSSLEPSYHFKQPFNTIEEHFIETDLPNEPTIPISSNDLVLSRVLRDDFSHTKTTKKSTEKAHILSKCGYDSCPKIKKDSINIHLVPHSHDDPGYQKTMDEYFYGLRNDIYNVSISQIIDSVIHQLTLNKDRKFIYAEVVYFSKWWQMQNDTMRETVRDLVKNGRFEFINGGWCVHDEATTNYADIIDQMSLGLSFLAETFGECGRPKVAFQADTFGHSREQALLSSLMGYDALFIGRVDREDKKRRIDELEMEMIWSGSDRPGKHPSIFTGITYNVFDPPPGFCFDNICGNPRRSVPINDDIDSEDYNVEELVEEFLDYCWKQADAYKTNNIVVYMGSDFTYAYAEVWFKSMDKLIKHINKLQKDGNSPFNIFYSTPACYVKAINDANLTWPTKKDDFFPYHGELPNYWAGFYSSRPALKYMIRQGSSLLQSCKQMASILKLKGAEDNGDLSVMKEAMAVLQHHDAITGTHSQRVSNDYVRILHKGVEECTKTMNSYYQTELPRNEGNKKFHFSVSYCNQLNISQCEVTDRIGHSFVVNIYNPLGKFVDKYIRVPVIQEFNQQYYNYRVIDSNGKIVPSQLMPIASFVESIPGRTSLADYDLIFLARKVPQLGSQSYFVEVSVSKRASTSSILVSHWNSLHPPKLTTNLKISNEKLSLVLSKETGLITSVTIVGKKKIPLDQQFYWYNSNGINCGFTTTKGASGVYVFNPMTNSSAIPMNIGAKYVTVYKGDLLEEIHQTINDYIGQVIRLYKGQDYIEFDWVVGPVPIEDGVGKEIITRYSTDFENNGEFYTDSNGRQSVLRVRDKRQTYNLDSNHPVASNYYPITSHVFMTDYNSGYRLNVVTDRAQGGGSIEDGELELLIHRRLVQQDFCLFKEPLDEMAHGEGLVVRGTHTLFFEDTKDEKKDNQPESSTLRSLVQERSLQLLISFTSMNYTSDQWIRYYWSKLQFLSRPLPENVKLLTFAPRTWHEGEYILRLEHIYDVDEHPILSNPAKISLKEFFRGFNIEELEETTLDGNLIKSDLRRLSWKSNEKNVDANFEYNTSPASLDHIKLMPMEIRTFIIRPLAS